jgi:plasmid maintenance system killer protein
MIKSFANEDTANIYNGIYTHTIRKLLPSHLVKVAQRKMDILNCTDSTNIASCFPGEKGQISIRDAHGKYSIPIDENWRIAFGWDQDNAIDVEIKP